LLIGGKPLSEFNKSVADYEKEFLKTGVKDKELKKKGIKTYGDAIEHIAKIAQDVQGKTVIHSAEKSDEIYEIIKRIFAEEHEDYKKQASEILGDFNPNAAPPQELQDEMEKTDIKKILEGMKGTDSGKSGEGRNFVNRMEKEAERQAEEMIKVCEDNGVKLAVSYVYRFHPLIRKAKELIGNEYIGKLVSINLNFNIDMVPGNNFRFNKELSGGGALRDLGTHMIDLLRFFGGEIKSIEGSVDNVVYKSDVDDFAAAIVHFEKGGYGYFNVSYNNKKAFNRVEILGNKGAISIEKYIGNQPAKLTAAKASAWRVKIGILPRRGVA